MTGFFMMLGLVVSLLHLLGGAIAFVWLLLLGQWSTVGVGLLALVLGGLIIRLALLPGLWLFGTPAAILRQGRRHRVARVFYALVGANTVLVMGAWCLFWAWIFLSRAEADTRIPLLLWSYAVAVGPWSRIAGKNAKEEERRAKAEGREPELPGAQVVTFLVQLAYVCGGVAWLTGWTSFQLAALPLWTLALVVMASVSVRQQQDESSGRLRRIRRPGAATIEGEGEVSPPRQDREEG